MAVKVDVIKANTSLTDRSPGNYCKKLTTRPPKRCNLMMTRHVETVALLTRTK